MKQNQDVSARTLDNKTLSVDYIPSSKVNHGVFITRKTGIILLAIFVTAIIVTALLAYNLAVCSRIEPQPYSTQKNDISLCSYNSTLSETTVSVTSKDPPSTAAQETNPAPDVTTEARLERTISHDVRLPRSVIPDSYSIAITPFFSADKFSFVGEVYIRVNVTENCYNITLHSLNLEILNITLKSEYKNTNVEILKQHINKEKHFLILHTSEMLRMGESYSLQINYRGVLTDNMQGFYRSSYNYKNETRWIAVTQFQATDARQAFPCFDEPALKASFIITIGRPKNMTSISNMHRLMTKQHHTIPDYEFDFYDKSPPMSTYLVAFAVTDFANKTNGIFTVWAREDAIESASFALEIGPKMLKYCEEFYKIAFPLKKVDMLAVPDFNAGAMENWGLLTFRETALLYEEYQSPKVAQLRIASILAHELAHQWFGNLVTPTWWSDLWLNEGFASYVETLVTDAVEKSWKIQELYVINEIQSVFVSDALKSSHQISMVVSNPEEILEIFDTISYGKGSAIIRMMNHFLTEEVFNAGVTDYLNKRKYSNADQNDLWTALTHKAKEIGTFKGEVSQVMDTWTLQTGFPVVTVTRNYKKGSLHFKQERFTLINDATPSETTWWIPISYTSAREKDFEDTRPKLWMQGEREVSLDSAGLSSDDWVVVNIQETGFYRVNYDKTNWDLIIKTLNDPASYDDIAPINRAQIVDDVMNLALSGRIDYNLALDVTKYLKFERSYAPWKAGLTAMGYLDFVLSKTAYYLEYKRHALTLLEGIIEDLGFDSPGKSESMTQIQQRVDLFNVACHLEHPECMSYAVKQFHNWMMEPNPDVMNGIPVDLRGAVYCAGISAGGQREWEFTWERFKRVKIPSERDLLLSVLGCTRAPYLLHRYINMALTGESSIRKQDIVTVFASLSNSIIGQPIALSVLLENCKQVQERFGHSLIIHIVRVVGKRLSSPQELEQIMKLLDSECKTLPGRALDQVIEMTTATIKWQETNLGTIVKWLKTREYDKKRH